MEILHDAFDVLSTLALEWWALLLALALVTIPMMVRAYLKTFAEKVGESHGSAVGAWSARLFGAFQIRRDATKAKENVGVWVGGSPPPLSTVRREAVIEKIRGRLTGSDGRLLYLHGPPGVGKTTLIRDFIEASEDLFELCLYFRIDVERAGLEPTYAVESLALGLREYGIANSFDVSEIGNPGESFHRLVAKTAPKPTLIAIDDLDLLDADLQRDIIYSASAIPTVAMLAAGRTRILDSLYVPTLPVPLLGGKELSELVENFHTKSPISSELRADALFEVIPKEIRGHVGLVTSFLSSAESLPVSDLQTLSKNWQATRGAQDLTLAWLRKSVPTACLPVLLDCMLQEKVGAKLADRFDAPEQRLNCLETLQRIGVLTGRKPPGVSDFWHPAITALLRDSDHDLGVVFESAKRQLDAILAEISLESDDTEKFADVIRLLVHTVQIEPRAEILSTISERRLDQIANYGTWKAYWSLCRLGYDAACALGETERKRKLGMRILRRAVYLGERATSERLLHRMIELTGPNDSPSVRIELLDHHAVFLEATGDHDGAIETAREAEAILHEAPAGSVDIETECAVLWLRGSLLVRSRRFESALPLLEQAIMVARRSPVPLRRRFEAQLLLAQARLELDEADDEVDAVEAELEQAAVDAESQKIFTVLPKIWLFLAHLRNLRGDVKGAQAMLDRARSLPALSEPGTLTAISLFTNRFIATSDALSTEAAERGAEEETETMFGPDEEADEDEKWMNHVPS
jgi:tetratricopeptide (TPR) repeat protein